MFTMGGVLGAAGNQGGGGDGFPTSGLIALFNDAGTYYNGTSKEWVASNDATMKLDNTPSSPPVGVDSDNRLEFASGDHLTLNAALKTALAVDDITVVVGTEKDSGSTTWTSVRVHLQNGNSNQFILTVGYNTDVADLVHERSNTAGNVSPSVDDTSFVVCMASGARSGKGTVTVDDGTPAVSSSDAGDAALITSSGNFYVGSFDGGSHIGFVAFYSGVLSEDDYATLLSTVEGNADYGAEDYSL